MYDAGDLYIQGLIIDWSRIGSESYLRDIDAICSLTRLPFEKSVTFFVGENGSGKSTLLEAIAVASGFNPEGGTRNYSFSTYDSHSELCDAMTLVKGCRRMKWGYFLRAESFYNVATYAEEVGLSEAYHQQSHGESFLTLAQSNFRAGGLYLLDEPEAALSPQRQLALLMEIHRCVKEGSQFIIASHSPILLGLPGAAIYSFDGNIRQVDWEDTDSYRVTKMFIEDRGSFLRYL